jgi:hypothetical protein
MWRDYNPADYVNQISDETSPIVDRVQALISTASNAVTSSGMLASTDAARYWTYHLARMGFFTVQGLVSLAVSIANKLTDGSQQTGVAARFGNVLPSDLSEPVGEALLMFYQDWNSIQEGVRCVCAREGGKSACAGHSHLVAAVLQSVYAFTPPPPPPIPAPCRPVQAPLGHDHPAPPPVQPAVRLAAWGKLCEGGGIRLGPKGQGEPRGGVAPQQHAACVLPGEWR